MSEFFSKKFKNLESYVPGEQPKDTNYIKLNTNESPFDVPAKVYEHINNARALRLYCDCDCVDLTEKLASTIGVDKENLIFTNGSDDILDFAFMAYCDEDTPAVFPNITYGFYEVFANVNNVPYEIKNLNEDFTINIDDYKNVGKTIFIANPNAWTGIALSRDEIEEIVKSNPNNIVVIDEAYVDFGAESAVPLIKKYDNLLVTQTFSKSRSLAGARLGFGIACPKLIRDLNTIKYSTNPYNINSLTQAAGIGVLECEQEMQDNIKKICKNREYLAEELKKLGFEFTPSKANFLLVRSNKISGKEFYEKLKESGILVRHSSQKEISNYIRITIGSFEDMKKLVEVIKNL